MFAPQELETKVTEDRKVVIPFPENIPVGATVKITYDVQVIEDESPHVPVGTPPDYATLETLYEWEDAQVLPFLNANPSLVSFLIEAQPAIKRYFGDVVCKLELDRSLDETGILNLFVIVSQEPLEVLAVLEKFDDEWWDSRELATHGKLGIHTRFSDHG